MTLSAESTFMAAVVGLYIYDSALLLHSNEALLCPRRGGKWAVIFGSANFELFGKELLVLNLLMLHQPVFRLSWDTAGVQETSETWTPNLGTYTPLKLLTWANATGLLVFLPLGFFTYLGNLSLLVALILIYLSISLALVWVWKHRVDLDISNRNFSSLAFESLICPPFALNLVRHVSLNSTVREDLVGAARRLQMPCDWAITRQKLSNRLKTEIDAEESGTMHYKQLIAHQEVLAKESDSCHS